jgi:hypothetical protein
MLAEGVEEDHPAKALIQEASHLGCLAHATLARDELAAAQLAVLVLAVYESAH